MGDSNGFNIVFSLEVLFWNSVYINLVPKWSLFTWKDFVSNRRFKRQVYKQIGDVLDWCCAKLLHD